MTYRITEEWDGSCGDVARDRADDRAVPMKIYIVVREDRHTDDEITVHRTLPAARAAAQEFQERDCYDHEEWEEDPVDAWLYHAQSTHDDGPSVRIEEGVLE